MCIYRYNKVRYAREYTTMGIISRRVLLLVEDCASVWKAVAVKTLALNVPWSRGIYKQRRVKSARISRRASLPPVLFGQ